MRNRITSIVSAVARFHLVALSFSCGERISVHRRGSLRYYQYQGRFSATESQINRPIMEKQDDQSAATSPRAASGEETSEVGYDLPTEGAQEVEKRERVDGTNTEERNSGDDRKSKRRRTYLTDEELAEAIGWKVEDVTYQRSIGATDKDIRSKAHWKKHRKLARQKRKSVIAKKVKEAKAKEESGEQIVEDGLPLIPFHLIRHRWKGLSVEDIEFAKPIVAVDCGFDGKLSFKEQRSLGSQICHLYGSMKRLESPLQLHLTSLSGDIGKFLKTVSAFDSWKFHKHEAAFQDVFPTEKLVYLSPDSDVELKEVDKEKIYVLGGIVDHNRLKNATLSKAQGSNIFCARLPIESSLGFKPGNSLAINHVYEILARRAFGIPWDRCLEPFVPRRKGFRPHRVGQPNAKGVDADVDAGEVKEKASACSSGKETEEDRNTAVVHGGNAGAETEERDESSIRYLATPHDVVLI